MNRVSTLVLEWRALVARAEGFFGPGPLAEEGAAERRGTRKEVRVIAHAVGGDQPGRGVDHVDDEAVMIHLVACAAVEDALMEEERIAGLAENHVANRELLLARRLRERYRAVVAAGNHDHVAHVR